MQKSHQEHPCTWRMFLTFLIIMMVTMIPEVTSNVLDFAPGFQKYMTHGVNNVREPSRTSLYLEDVPELPDHPDADHDGDWSRAYYIGGHQLVILMFESSL